MTDIEDPDRIYFTTSKNIEFAAKLPRDLHIAFHERIRKIEHVQFAHSDWENGEITTMMTVPSGTCTYTVMKHVKDIYKEMTKQ